MKQPVIVEPLIAQQDFLAAKEKGRRVVASGLILNGMKAQHDVVKLGYIVSRHVGNAVQRNRAKRRLRAVVREVLPAHGKAGYNLVLIGRKQTASRPFIGLKKDFTYALHQLYEA